MLINQGTNLYRRVSGGKLGQNGVLHGPSLEIDMPDEPNWSQGCPDEIPKRELLCKLYSMCL